MAIKGTVKSR